MPWICWLRLERRRWKTMGGRMTWKSRFVPKGYTAIQLDVLHCNQGLKEWRGSKTKRKSRKLYVSNCNSPYLRRIHYTYLIYYIMVFFPFSLSLLLVWFPFCFQPQTETVVCVAARSSRWLREWEKKWEAHRGAYFFFSLSLYFILFFAFVAPGRPGSVLVGWLCLYALIYCNLWVKRREREVTMMSRARRIYSVSGLGYKN